MPLPRSRLLEDLFDENNTSLPGRLSPQVTAFPTTRFMGSKEQLLGSLWNVIGAFAPRRVLDLCSGSGVVSYMLKAQGCSVIANDQMAMANVIAEATISNSHHAMTDIDIDIISGGRIYNGMIWNIYDNIYYEREDVAFLDHARLYIHELESSKRAIALAALIRACLKRRARGIFTYTGQRYDDGRKDLKLTLSEHFGIAVRQINGAVFDNGTFCSSTCVDISLGFPDAKVDLVYLDPPYFSPLSDNDYVRRYHFTEALARDWQGIELQEGTKTRKFRNYPNPFRTELLSAQTIERTLEHYAGVPIVLSYSSNSLPSAAAIKRIIMRQRQSCKLVEVDHRYSFGNQSTAQRPIRNKVKELIFIAE